MSRYLLYKKNDGWAFRVLDAHDKIVMTSETYSTKKAVLESIASLKKSSAVVQPQNPVSISKDLLKTYKGDFERLANR